MKQLVKRLVLPGGRRFRRLRGGIAKGMLMELDLAHQSQRYFGFDERELLGVLRRLMTQARSLIDIGANDGYYTMAFLRSDALRVVACEPGPAMERLLANAKANGYEPCERFRAERRLVGLDRDGVSIAELVKELPRPVLLKVDIDGGEFELLQSAEGFDSLRELRWLIETHSPELEKQCVAWLQAHGYRTQIIYNARWRVLLPEERPIEHNRWLMAEPAQA
ncbi:MAG TPA: FkbM family methyltransferase [Pyrinomonadaceae bacterium]|jgi:hypothetical protein